MTRLARISTSVVKGTALDHPDSLEIGWQGYERDRLFYFVDERGVMLSGKRFGPLVQVRCEYDAVGELLTMRYPGGDVVTDRVRLTDEHVTISFWGRDVPSTVVGGTFAQAASAYIGKQVRMVRTDVPGTGNDHLHPVTIVATATLDHFAATAAAPTQHWRDRFRMLLELDGLEPFQEESWLGRSLRIGELVVTVQSSIPRCVVTSQNPRTGVKDFDSLKAVRTLRTQDGSTRFPPAPDSEEYGGLLLGLYATVARPGIVHVDDEVCPVAESSTTGTTGPVAAEGSSAR